MEGDQTAKLSSLGVLEKTSCGMPLSRTLWPLPTCGHLPNSRGGGREGVYPQNRKVQRIILDPPLHPASSGNPRPHQLRRPVLFSELGQKLRATTSKMRETALLFQRILITIQRFNAVAFRGTFASQDTDELTAMTLNPLQLTQPGRNVFSIICN